jgi:hypothetical protein
MVCLDQEKSGNPAWVSTLTPPFAHPFALHMQWAHSLPVCAHMQWAHSLPGRVAKLGEFSPTGWFLTLGSRSKITKVAEIYGLCTIFQSKGQALILTKNMLGYILGDSFLKLIWSPCCQGRFEWRTGSLHSGAMNGFVPWGNIGGTALPPNAILFSRQC